MPIVTSSTDHHFDLVMVWDNLGGAVRVRRNGLAQVIDPSAGTPVTVTQDGQPTSVVRSDANGRVTFVAQQGIVRLVADGLAFTAVSAEQAVAGADNAAQAQMAQTAAESARDDAQAAAAQAQTFASDAVARLDLVEQQQNQLAQVTPTLDEMVTTCIVRTDVVGHILFSAPFPCRIAQVLVASPSAGVAASDTDYMSIDLHRFRAGAIALIGTKNTRITSGEALTVNQPWSFDGAALDTTRMEMSVGDGLRCNVSKVGAATLPLELHFTIRYVPA